MSDMKLKLQLAMLTELGRPLLEAADHVVSVQDQQAVKTVAEQVATLLGRTVQASIAMGETLRLGADHDAERLALAALAASIMGGAYKDTKGRMPEEAEIQRIASAVDAILSFSDHFDVTSNAATRLNALSASEIILDETQFTILYLEAYVPVIEAVNRFAFGRAEKKLMALIAARLSDDAKQVVAALGDAPSDVMAAYIYELQVLKMLTAIYAASHNAETNYIYSSGPEALNALMVQGVIPLDPVWDGYETRLAMLLSLCGIDRDAGKKAAGGIQPATDNEEQVTAFSEQPAYDVSAANQADLGMQAPVTPQSPVAAMPEAAQNATVPVFTQPQQDDSADMPPLAANPMSFFAKSKRDEG
jgi:hypothetical protein